jgi:hypothetical protein
MSTSSTMTNPITSNRLAPISDEPLYTVAELSKPHRLHPTTVRRMFRNEPGVLRISNPIGAGKGKNRRQHFTLRIPASVAARVFARFTAS